LALYSKQDFHSEQTSNMTAQAVATLINLLAYITGIALYTMLLLMLLGARAAASRQQTNKLPLATAVLGLVWTLGAFAVFGLEQLSETGSQVWMQTLAFTALGFLPAVVVHSVLRRGEAMHGRSLWLTIIAYSLSAVASALHVVNAVASQPVPSHVALHLLTIGFGGLIVLLLVLTLRAGWWRSAGWVIALAVFAVSASHLSHHEGDNYAWWVELIGHHSSLPLALVILYQDYRFALADIFLKRALSLFSLVALASVLYFVFAAPLMTNAAPSDPRVVGALLALWIVTALLYPHLKRAAHWFVDTIILQRVDYEALREDIAKIAERTEEPDELLNEVCRRLAQALTARRVMWQAGESVNVRTASPRLNFLRRKRTDDVINATASKSKSAQRTTERTEITERKEETPNPIVLSLNNLFFLCDLRALRGFLFHKNYPNTGAVQTVTAAIPVRTTDQPNYQFLVGELAGGRRLLSDDLAMLEAVALIAARRIDAMRVTHERYEHELREQEITALATEAELRALRAQINPHFLFNAMTTIGYLIQEAPDRAVQTLMRLTALLRGVLRRSEGEFTTLGEEVELIADYLEIEQARFEQRLRVTIDVPASLCAVRIPALLLQPLVENAIKHGISPLRVGGEVIVSARLDAATKHLNLIVKDTGAGADQHRMRTNSKDNGIGLANVERRLRVHFDERATMCMQTAPGQGMTVELKLPLQLMELDKLAVEAFAASGARRSR
jgi:two-component system, LytTR family, sensor kinase